MIPHDLCIVRAIDAGNAEADGCRAHVTIADGVVHDLMEHLFDLELADGLQVGATAARFGQHLAVLVGELADCLGSTGVDAENVTHPGIHFIPHSIACSKSTSIARTAGKDYLPAVLPDMHDSARRNLMSIR
jgi:hypothetical protein